MTVERTDENTAKDPGNVARSYVEVEENLGHPQLPDWISLKPKVRRYREHPIAGAVRNAKEGIFNEKVLRCIQFQKKDDESVPVSFSENTNKEKLILEHVKKYAEQFNLAYKDTRYSLNNKESFS